MGQLVDHVAHVCVLSDLRVTECNALFALYTDDSCTIRESLTIEVKQRKISIVANLTQKKRNVCKLDSEKRKCVNWPRKYKMCENWPRKDKNVCKFDPEKRKCVQIGKDKMCARNYLV